MLNETQALCACVLFNYNNLKLNNMKTLIKFYLTNLTPLVGRIWELSAVSPGPRVTSGRDVGGPGPSP